MDSRDSQWRTGFWRRMPLWVVLPMVIDIMCHGVEHLAIIWDNMGPFDERPAFLPSLGHIVGMAASLGNAMMGIVSYQAGVVNFWLEAIRGMRLSDFHNNWASPMNAMDATRALWNGRAIRISLVSLLVAATMLARTPIIHSAYHTEAATIPSFGIAAVDMTPSVTHYGFLPYSMAATSLNAFRGLQANQPIMFGEDVCDECTLNALGLGWNLDCWSLDAGWYDFEAPILDARSDSVTHGLFVINVTESTGQGGFRITIRTMRKSEDGCKGMYIGEQCTLSPVVARYELNVRGRFTKFEPKNKIEFVEPYPPYHIEIPGLMWPGGFDVHDSRFLHLANIGQAMFNTYYGATYFPSSKKWLLGDDDNLDHRPFFSYLYSRTTEYQGVPQLTPNPPCYLSYTSPMEDVLNMYDELALRISVLAAADLPEDCGDYITTQFVGTTGSRTIVWNLRNIPLLVVAAVVGLMGHIGLVVACWGWWGLGRTVSMSPLELANAIIPRAPGPTTGEQPDPLAQGFSSALASCRTNATARQLEKHLRHMDDEGEMAYGLIPAATTIGFDETGRTEEVREGEMLR